MKIEDRLHDALHEYADEIEPSPDSWAAIVARIDEEPSLAPRPSRRPLVLAGVALALVVVLIASLVVRDNGDDTKVVTGPSAAATGAPSRYLALTTAGKLVVHVASTGASAEEFDASNVDSSVPLAITPDTVGAYVVNGRSNGLCAGHSIQEMPGGQLVGTSVTSPTVSADGRYLAFLRCPAGTDLATEIALRDLTTGDQRITPAPDGMTFAGTLQFAGDSRHVLVTVGRSDPGAFTVHVLDLVGGESAPGLAVSVDPDVLQLGWLGSHTGSLVGWDSGASPTTIIALSPDPVAAGAPTLVVTAAPIPGPITQVTSDASGRHLLVVVNGFYLFRWDYGDDRLTKVADGVRSATWLPDAESAPAPLGVLIGHRDGSLTVVGAQDGQQHSSLGTFPGLASASTTPDGRTVYFRSNDTNTVCPGEVGPIVTRLDPATGQTTRIAGGMISPAVSTDGEWIAYGTWCDGTTLGLTHIGSGGGNARTNPLGEGDNEADVRVLKVEPLGWSPDSTLLLYRLALKGDEDPHYYVGRVWPVVALEKTKVTALPHGSNVTAAAFVDNETVALAETTTSGQTEVRSWKIATGSEELPSPVIFTVTGKVTSLVADRSGRHFLAVTDAGVLYRWSQGDDQPTRVAENVATAAWLPWS
jgi:WD40-like Beta Propeller Repeat